MTLQDHFTEQELEPQELEPPATRAPGVSPTEQRELRAFYSGHSLTDGLPEQVLTLASLAGQSFDFEFQSLPGSTIRERTQGENPEASRWAGLRAGRNRVGEGLDVALVLRGDGEAAPYDALVVTERHDLPYAIAHEGTAKYLQALLRAGNPRGRTWLAHSWLEFDAQQPESWIDYESQALLLWECVASVVNRATDGEPSVFVIPGGAALAHVVEHSLHQGLPGLPSDGSGLGGRFLFRDSVHLSDWGRLFVGAVHYAALWGEPARWDAGAPALPQHPAGGDAEALARALLDLSWQYSEPYLMQAAARAQRPPEMCRRYAGAEEFQSG